MDVALKTPLLESFRRDDVERDVRLAAARGAVAARVVEQLALFALLVDDPDPEVAAAADATLRGIASAPLAAVLARADVTPEMREFFAGRGIQPSGVPSQDDNPLVDLGGDADTDAPPADEQSMLQKLQGMNVPQKLARATKGTREERAILVRDPNKMISLAVLSSPRLTESEVEAIAKMSSVSEEVLRTISHTRGWMKNYAVASALVKNPKTPLALSMNLLSRLNEKDLKILSTNRNVPEVLRTTARKKIIIA